MAFRRILTVAVLSGLLVGLFVVPASAVQVPTPLLTITGEPTAEETVEIQAQFDRLLASFPAARTCVQPLTVEVVDTAEAAWGGGVTGIAAFYKRSLATVFIEHGKVRDEHLIHEFAHHLDFSCGFGSGPLGNQFLEAQGFGEGQEWARGSSWSAVPAEHFAEAVVGWLGIDSVDLPVSGAAYTLVARFASYGPSLSQTPAPIGATLRNIAF